MNPDLAIAKLQAIFRGRKTRSQLLWPCAICKAEAPYYEMTQINKKWRCPDCSQGIWGTQGFGYFYICPCNRLGCEKGCRLLPCGCINTHKDGYDCPENRKEGMHYCGDFDCDGGCGVLWCGCIDVCRGRCGLDHPRLYR